EGQHVLRTARAGAPLRPTHLSPCLWCDGRLPRSHERDRGARRYRRARQSTAGERAGIGREPPRPGARRNPADRVRRVLSMATDSEDRTAVRRRPDRVIGEARRAAYARAAVVYVGGVLGAPDRLATVHVGPT